MIGLLCFVLAVLASPFKSQLRLEAENAVLRHQLNVLRRRPVASGSRTVIAGSLFSYIVGFLLSCRFSRSSSPRRSCVGIGPAFATTGVGSRAHWEGDRRS